MSRSALIYTAIAAIAIASVGYVALRDPAQPIPATLENASELEALREGTLKKLAFHPAPKPAGKESYTTADGTSATLADHAGRYVLLNFWPHGARLPQGNAGVRGASKRLCRRQFRSAHHRHRAQPATGNEEIL